MSHAGKTVKASPKERTIERKVIPHRRALTLRAAKGLCPFGNTNIETLCQEHREFSN